MTRPVSEPQRVKNDARRSKYQAKAPVTSHETRSQWTLSQLALPLSSSCVGASSTTSRKVQSTNHSNETGPGKMYARGIRSPSEGETVRVARLQCSERVPDTSHAAQALGLATQPANGGASNGQRPVKSCRFFSL